MTIRASIHGALASLAFERDRDLDDLIELWSERAAVREYLGGFDRDEAEDRALDDVEALA